MDNLKSLSDNKLISLLKESDHAAYTEIYNRYFFLLYTHAYKKLRDEDQAKDVVQELFANLWFKREFELNITNLAGYLYTSVRNRIFDLYAHQQVESRYVDSLSAYLALVKNETTDHLARENNLKFYIEKEIQALPRKMRRIFEMSRKQHLSHKEIAEQLSTTEHNVSKQVTNALRILRTKLSYLLLLYFLIHR